MIHRSTAINYSYGLPGWFASPETFASISASALSAFGHIAAFVRFL